MYYFSDGHCDYLDKVIRYGFDIDNPKENQMVRLKDMQTGGMALQFFAAWLDVNYADTNFNQFFNMLDVYRQMLASHKDTMVEFSRTFVPGKGKIATLFTVEDLGALENCCSVIPALKRAGVNAATLSHAYDNALCGSSTQTNTMGLTEYGRNAVCLMEENRIAVDVSHVSDATVEDLLGYAKKPIFASHSCAKAVYDVKRTLKDEYIKAIADRGGVVCVNFCNEHLTNLKNGNIKIIADHMIHVFNVGGENCCGMGSDFDGIDFAPDGLETAAKLQDLASELRSRGLTEKQVEKIAYYNLANYIGQFV